ncbi:MAG: hypothetical protein IPN19_12475 [Elusimicrobia bacterium]|nr:hypothetical protein [Elusimicrobiota bacterium]
MDETITTILMRGGHKQSVVAGTSFTSRLIKTISVGPTLSKAWTSYKKFKDKSSVLQM